MDEAEQEVRRALALNSKSPDAYTLLGIVLSARGAYADSLSALPVPLTRWNRAPRREGVRFEYEGNSLEGHYRDVLHTLGREPRNLRH